MISYLEGKLVSKEPSIAIMDVSGVGYEVRISLNTYSTIKDLDKSKLHTHLHIKEDSHTLYGFSDPKEKKRFLELISISGVGPATGLMILSSLSPEELWRACLTIEKELGRFTKGDYAPRTLDLDILAYGNQILESADLTIPHSRLHE